jgi:phage shock protein A
MSEPKPSEEPIDAEVVEEDAGPPPVVPEGDYTDKGVPTFDFVRDRIEGRYATSTGASELAADTSQTVDEKMAERDKAGRDKLEEIRRAMRERP